ncbi:calcium-dependent protein kinase 22 [Zea mays]|uniref:non-specific serine/threonine protein kinase n=1 Tax=Zea mays TaxID=4577 RepID=A0A1D6ET07_MAIZE|nr:calcium-dependent protein kinase 22 [Zea mays]ONM22840.1 LRR receptor-like serine/threonine-protein kinase GSO1 [Zea mays]ONM22841.1 LRR receptor-like serine/threonine-protein kinase GSO1 [Zea mays]ONM22843.1 LRR receptor-like serine/threonine-protein kinase GSO1 [Zea mays]|eukprot:XP_008670318.1 calcium-dependent protein kinase 22 [Zea mays]
MGGWYSAIAATRLKMLRRGCRGAAAVLPVASHDSVTGKERKRKRRKHASILGDSGTVDPDFSRRYRLGAELGRGEFGVTRRCEDAATGEALACKTIRRKRLLLRRAGLDADDVRREVEITRRMSEAGGGRVVRLREACEDDDGVHLVVELCEGGELFDRIFEREHYSERAAAKLARTIVEVVQLCHENGVMHRDLKPENFLFVNKSEESPLKAIDFGLSVFFKPGDRFAEVVGSGCYMAPEVLKRSYGPEIDVWSAGVILHLLLCGFPPFWGDSDEKIAQSILRGVINLQKDPWPKVSQSAKDLVRKMLDPDPCTRLTAKQVLEHPWLKNADKASNASLGEVVRSRLKQLSSMNKFKKKALGVVAMNLPTEEVDQYNQMFRTMDKDNDGNLSLEDLKEGFRINGHPVPEEEIKMLLQAGDIHGSGTLDCEEFVTVLLHIKKLSNDEYLPKAFKFFDKDKNGFIEMAELMEALGDGELKPNEQVVNDIIREVDKDKDGRISYPEFELMMKGGSDWRNASRRYSRENFSSLSRKLCKDTL